MLNQISTIISGALAGYITNDVAVNMLFKKYFGIGGVIVNTRKDFEIEVSKLVEKEIINHHTIKKELNSIEIEKELNEIMKIFLTEKLYKNIEKDKVIEELSFGKDTIEDIKMSLFIDINNKLKSFFSSFLKSVDLSQVLTEDQLKENAKQINKLIINILKEENNIKKFILDIYEENNNKSFNEVTNRIPLKIINEFYSNNFSRLDLILKNEYFEDIENGFEQVYKILRITENIDELLSNIEEKEILEVLGNEKAKELIKFLKEEFFLFLEKSSGKDLIKNFSKIIIEVLKKIDVTIYDLLDSEIENGLNHFIRDNLPEIISDIIEWVKENKTGIERAIEESVDETISEYGAVKRTLLNIIRRIFLENVSGKFDIVYKMINYIEQYKNDTNISYEITENILNILKEKKLSEIIKELEKLGIINEKIIYNLLIFNLNNYLKNIPEDKLTEIFKIKISIFYKFDRNELNLKIKNELKNILYQNIYEEKFSIQAKKIILDKISDSFEKNIEELIEKREMESVAEFIEEKTIEMLDKSNIEVEKMIFENIKNDISKKNIFEFIGEKNIKELSSNINKNLKNVVEEKLYYFKNLKLTSMFDKINKIENVEEKLSKILLTILDIKLESSIGGEIEKIVFKNIKKMSDDELKNMIQNFMGKELKTITYLGGGFGLVAGVGMLCLTNIMKDFSLYTSLILNSIILGTTGVLTNKLAIYSIFRPYNKKLGWQGVVPKNKSRFAKEMGKFIDTELLKEESLKEYFEKKKEKLISEIKEQAKANEFEFIGNFINSNIEKCFELFFNIIKEEIIKNQTEIVNKLTKELDYVSLEKFDFQDLENKLKKLKYNNDQNIEKLIQEKFLDNEYLRKNIKDILPEEMIQNIYEKVNNNLENFIKENIDKHLNEEKIIKELYQNCKKLDYIFEKDIKDLIGNDTYSIRNKFLNYFEDKKDDIKNSFSEMLNDNLKNELKSDKKVKDIFNGKLYKFLLENIDNYIDIIKNQIINSIRIQENNIVYEVINGVANELNWGEKVAYNLLKGDEFIRRVTNKFIYQKSYNIINRSDKKIKDILKYVIEKKLSNQTISSIKIKTNNENVGEIVKNILEDEEIKENFISMSEKIIGMVLDKNLKYYLKPLNIKNMQNLLELFEIEIKESLKETIDMIDEEKINEEIMIIIKKMLNEKLLNKKIEDILLSNENKEIIVEKINNLIFKSLSFEKNIDIFIEVFIERLKTKDLREILSMDILKKDIKNLIENDEFFEKIYNNLIDINKKDIEEIINNIFKNININTKEDIAELILKSFFDALEVKFSELLKVIDISKITENEINNMENKKLKDLFYSFAGKYFKKLIIYGLFGAIFGIPYLGVTSGSLYLVKEKFIKNK